jgi:release factor glutamine methyltransferase
MDLAVTPEVLIPRPETECIVEAALALLPEHSGTGSTREPKRILELGTGSGAIILALASMRPNHLFFAGDHSMGAVKLAQKNARQHDLEHVVDFFFADWFSALKANDGPFDMILSNPPYIPTRIIARLQPEVNRYEPISAIDGNRDGLGCIKSIIDEAHRHLKTSGHLLLEMGHDQKRSIQNIIDTCAAYEDVVFSKDYGGFDRIVQMQKKSCE